MLNKPRGFTLAETLIAMLIGSVLLLACARLLPALHRAILQQARNTNARQQLWQLAFTIGKHLQRAGYCKGDCPGNGLYLNPKGNCLIIQWDINHNGYWETAPLATAEQTGYRLRFASIETQKGVSQCDSKGWEKITDPTQLRISQFHIHRQPRTGLPPLLHIHISAHLAGSHQIIQLQHSVVGYNL